jgi:hypothetical protein
VDNGLGFWVMCGIGAAGVAAACARSAWNSHTYRPQPEAEALRAHPRASERMSANEGRLWLTVTPDAIVVQPRSPSILKQTDQIFQRSDVLCVDIDFASSEGERLNIYRTNGVIAHRLQVDRPPYGVRVAAAHMLREWGWPIGEHLWAASRPPDGEGRSAEVVRWMPYWESPTAGWD